MVHLSTVSRSDTPTRSPSSPDLASLPLPTPGGDVTTTVYGSRFAAEDLPRHTLPEGEMPRDVAYRMIKDELSLDGNPKMNLASFVTTYMEDEAEKLMTEAFPKNFIDYEEYPQTAELQSRCVNIISNLFHAPSRSAIGTSTVGSSEAIMLAVLAMKRRWQHKNGLVSNPSSRRPNMVMSSAVQVCWEKAVRYLDIDARYVNCERDRFVIDPRQAVDLVDEDTIGICLILGTTYTGEYEDIKAVNDLLAERNLDVGIHVDAASGGFVAPFVMPDLQWDFILDKVVSINVSGHKYGLVYPGVGWVIFRAPEHLPQDLVFNINYLGADQATFTLNFSKGASQVIGQYYQLVRLGHHGFRCIMANLTRTSDFLANSLEKMGFIILSQRGGKGLPVVAFRFATMRDIAAANAIAGGADEDAIEEDVPQEKDGGKPRLLCPTTYDEFALAHQLRTRGWILPAYTMAPNVNDMKLLRVVVREDLTRGRCDALVRDIKAGLEQLDKMNPQEVKQHVEMVRRSSMSVSGRKDHIHPTYKNETHSLQGKHGKTHAVC